MENRKQGLFLKLIKALSYYSLIIIKSLVLLSFTKNVLNTNGNVFETQVISKDLGIDTEHH